jgi:hypothetical protein
MLTCLHYTRVRGLTEELMERSGPGEANRIEVPHLVGMVVADARQAGHRAGLVVVSQDVHGPPLAGLTWPGIWIVMAQRPAHGTWLRR